MTKNFTGAELEGLVRAAQSTALNRLIKASNKVEVDPEAGKKVVVDRSDFMNALENDIKPVSPLTANDMIPFISSIIFYFLGIRVELRGT